MRETRRHGETERGDKMRWNQTRGDTLLTNLRSMGELWQRRGKVTMATHCQKHRLCKAVRGPPM